MDSNYFYHNDINETYIQLPMTLISDPSYQELSSDAKIIWGLLVKLQETSISTNWIDSQTGKIFFYELEVFISKMVDDAHKTRSIIDELVSFHLLEEIRIPNYDIKKYYLLKPKLNSTIRGFTESYLKDVKEIFANLGEKKSASKNEQSDQQALQFMKHSQKSLDVTMLKDSTIIILYNYFSDIEYLMKQGVFNLSLLLTTKNHLRLGIPQFNRILQMAFEHYDFNADVKKLQPFDEYFKLIHDNQEILDKEELLKSEITDKLPGISNSLKKFVYQELIKADEHFPDRFEFILHNLRVINTVYEDFGTGTVPDTTFEKAFRRLFMKEQIHSLAPFFKKAIQLVQKEEQKHTAIKQPKQDKTTTDSDTKPKNWLESVVKIDKDAQSVDKMTEEEKAEYFKKAEQLKDILRDL